MTDNHDDHRSLIMSEIMTPNMVNFHGNVHGGYVLALLDRVAYACASRYSAKTIVTLSVDQVVFKEPIHVGELVICLCIGELRWKHFIRSGHFVW